MNRSPSQLLRHILGVSHDADPRQCTTYVRFDSEDAIRIRIALSKGAERPMCPRCGATLRVETGTSTERQDRMAAFLCASCRRVVIIRLTVDSGSP